MLKKPIKLTGILQKRIGQNKRECVKIMHAWFFYSDKMTSQLSNTSLNAGNVKTEHTQNGYYNIQVTTAILTLGACMLSVT